MVAAIDVYERRRPNGEVWYGVKVNGRDLEAEWADPDAARGRGERYARELRGRGGTKMETTETETPDQTLPDEPDEDEKPDKETPPGHDPEGPGESENAPGHNKPEPKEDDED